MIIICPEEDPPDTDPNPYPGPDPGPITIPLPDPCDYFVRVTVVDTSNHAATLISIVQPELEFGQDFGDAPDTKSTKLGASKPSGGLLYRSWI